MAYRIRQLAEASGARSLTLRYFDEISLLKPKKFTSACYRLYGKNEVNWLQEILLYRKMRVLLAFIKQFLNNPTFNRKTSLEIHRFNLLQEKKAVKSLSNHDYTKFNRTGRRRHNESC